MLVVSLKISIYHLSIFLHLYLRHSCAAEEYCRAVKSKGFKIRQTYLLYHVLVTLSQVRAKPLQGLVYPLWIGIIVGQPHVVDVRITCGNTCEALRPGPGSQNPCSAWGVRQHLAWWPTELPGLHHKTWELLWYFPPVSLWSYTIHLTSQGSFFVWASLLLSQRAVTLKLQDLNLSAGRNQDRAAGSCQIRDDLNFKFRDN